jgi:hypothetical protein
MASQITHIPYAKKVLDMFLSGQKIDEKKFFIGTLFPDIRYLGVIAREKSHYLDPTVEGLLTIDGDFEKGRYTHALIDLERERTLTRLGAYDLLDNGPFVTFAMKFIEDEFSYNLIYDWNKYINFMNEVLSEEESLVSKEAVQQWHILIQKYFSSKPTPETVVVFSKDLKSFNPEYIPPTLKEMAKIRENSRVMEIIKNTGDNLFRI